MEVHVPAVQQNRWREGALERPGRRAALASTLAKRLET